MVMKKHERDFVHPRVNISLPTPYLNYLSPPSSVIIARIHIQYLPYQFWAHMYVWIYIEQIGKNYSEVVAVVIFHYGFYLLTTQSWGTLRHVLGPTFGGGVSRSLDYVYTLFSLKKKKSIDYLIFYLIRFYLQSLVLFKLFSPKLIRHNK